MQARKATSLAEVEGRTGDMRLRSVIYAPGGTIRVHISTKMSRYARLTLGIRLQWHYLGAYLRNESKGEKQASESPMAARCVTDHEQGCFALHCVSADYKKLMFAVRCPDERLCARDIQMLQILHSASGCVYGDKIDCV